MRNLQSVLNEARKLPLEERRRLAVRLLEEGDTSHAARQDEKLGAMRAAASDESFRADLTATMEDFRHTAGDGLPAWASSVGAYGARTLIRSSAPSGS